MFAKCNNWPLYCLYISTKAKSNDSDIISIIRFINIRCISFEHHLALLYLNLNLELWLNTFFFHRRFLNELSEKQADINQA